MKFNQVKLYIPHGGKTYCFKIPSWAHPKKRHFNTHQSNRKEAEIIRDDYLAQCMVRGKGQVYQDAYLDKVIDTFLTSKGHLAEATIKKYTQTLNEFKDFVVSRLARMPKIQEIEKQLIEAYLQTLLDRGLTPQAKNGVKPQTRNGKRDTVSSMFIYAVDSGWLDKNPVEKIKGIEELEPEHPVPLTLGEVKVVLDYLKNLGLSVSGKKNRCQCYYQIMAVVYYAGLRITEVTHLIKTDIIFEEHRIRLENKILPPKYSGKRDKESGRPIEKKYKTKTKVKGVPPIVPELEVILREWLPKVEDNPSPLLFPNLNGRPVDYDDIYKTVKKAGIKLGFPPEKACKPCHRGRHTFTSETRKYVEEPLVQQALGHTSNIMTRHYTHLEPDHVYNQFKGLSYGQDKKESV